jgi:WD40 repeat protein
MFAWHAHERAVTSLAFGPGGRFLLSAGDGWVKAWEPFSGAEQFAIPLPPVHVAVPLRWLTPSGDGKWAAVHEYSRRLLFLDLERERITAERAIPHIHALKRTPDGHSVAVLRDTGGDARLHVYDFASQSEAATVAGDWYRSRALAFSPDGSRIGVGRHQFRWLASGDRGTSVDVRRWYDEAEELAFSADGEHLFARVGGKVVVYSLVTSLFKTKLKGHCGPITAMELSPDGRRLWTASRDATVKCWDTHALTLDRTFRFDTGGLDCLAVSPDGNMAAVGSGQKGTITVWDLG